MSRRAVFATVFAIVLLSGTAVAVPRGEQAVESESSARAAARSLATSIPLPDGGNFNGVRWEEAGGVFSEAEITAVLSYNAACQWLRAWRDGRGGDTASRIVAELPQWSAWRGTETAEVLAQVGKDAANGTRRMIPGVLADCDSAHTREVGYAAARGLTPSR